MMLYREILVLVIIGSLIAIPLSYWLTNKLLHSFAYRAELSIGTALVTMAGAIVLSLGTVTYHSLKVSLINPARTLKYE
jgi:putative ABC transport system permease protein